MPLGQSYIAYKFAQFAGRGLGKMLDLDDEEAKKFGTAAGIFVGGVVAIMTADDLGAGASAADAGGSEVDSPGKRWLENNL